MLTNKKKIVQLDMDGCIADYDLIAKDYPDKERRHEKGFFLKLPVIKGSPEAVKILSKSYEIYFLSTAPWSNIHAGSEKRIWLDHHFGEFAYKRLILTHYKNLVIGDYLIDDRTKNGAAEFTGEHIHFGSAKFPNWDSVLEYLCPEENDVRRCVYCKAKETNPHMHGCPQEYK
jgi:5'-nucleotidase